MAWRVAPRMATLRWPLVSGRLSHCRPVRSLGNFSSSAETSIWRVCAAASPSHRSSNSTYFPSRHQNCLLKGKNGPFSLKLHTLGYGSVRYKTTIASTVDPPATAGHGQVVQPPPETVTPLSEPPHIGEAVVSASSQPPPVATLPSPPLEASPTSSSIFGGYTPEEVGWIPDAPLPPVVDTAAEQLAAAADATLHGLGLGSYFTPVGWVQMALDFLHTYTHAPWWLAIFSVVAVVKLSMFKFQSVNSQKLQSIQHNHQPKTLKLQKDAMLAQATGDAQYTSLLQKELKDYQENHGLSPIKQIYVLAPTFVLFMSFFWAVKGMAGAPMPAFQTEGLWWFLDLTQRDPYYVLPVASAITVALILRSGIETGGSVVLAQKSPWLRHALQFGMPVGVGFVTAYMPAAIGLYWLSSNTMSLSFASILRLESVRRYFDVPERIKHDPELMQRLKRPTNTSSFKRVTPLHELMKRDKAIFMKGLQKNTFKDAS